MGEIPLKVFADNCSFAVIWNEKATLIANDMTRLKVVSYIWST